MPDAGYQSTQRRARPAPGCHVGMVRIQEACEGRVQLCVLEPPCNEPNETTGWQQLLWALALPVGCCFGTHPIFLWPEGEQPAQQIRAFTCTASSSADSACR